MLTELTSGVLCENKFLIDEAHLSSMDDEALSLFSNSLRGAGFESGNLLELFGKEVMRYVNISSLENFFEGASSF